MHSHLNKIIKDIPKEEYGNIHTQKEKPDIKNKKTHTNITGYPLIDLSSNSVRHYITTF